MVVRSDQVVVGRGSTGVVRRWVFVVLLYYSTLLYDCMTGLVEPLVIVEPLNWHPRGGCVPLGGAVRLRASHPPSLTRVADRSSVLSA